MRSPWGILRIEDYFLRLSLLQVMTQWNFLTFAQQAIQAATETALKT